MEPIESPDFTLIPLQGMHPRLFSSWAGESSSLRERLESRIDLANEHLHALDGLVVVQEPGLAHDQEMPEAADVVVHLHDLAVDRIRVAREDQAVLHEGAELRLLEHLEDAWVGPLHRVHRRR